MPPLDSSLRSQLDTTLILEPSQTEVEAPQSCPLFALVSLNLDTAPSVEVPCTHLLALTLSAHNEPPVLTVGRHKDCHVKLEDPRVSLRHFDIVVRPKEGSDPLNPETLSYEAILNDKSSNGTSINGKIIGKGLSGQLRSGDEICVLPSNRVGVEHRVAFVFRNTSESSESPKAPEPDLLEHVVCPICMLVIYKCVALTPCLHNFCMACYSEWLARKDDCPVCRQHVTAVVKNHPMDAVISAFLEACPERRRTAEELIDMDARDRLRLGFGGKLVRGTCMVDLAIAEPVRELREAASPGSALTAAVPQAAPAAATTGASSTAAAASSTPAAGSGATSTAAASAPTSVVASALQRTTSRGTAVCGIQ
eukprot:gnl/TRDRNA2_/TRDRNA2_188824_c0_seq1.p1 gnl/TRDRNA2_/TRDRNA2_188824_c0~~gnl/TRDRNA2_/TRDRNA2_188824_c0_seq1.p1  ORF type:complete len:366 (+),score=71.74 gnl/TRDRNA2_/TRDRNA2_188824_c0_seq1:134-1231(+)